MALLVAHLTEQALGTGTTGSAVAVVLGGLVLGAGYVLLLRKVRVTDVDNLVGPVLRAAQGRRVNGRTRESE
jgi:LPXTG-motif cell wall-anchored protein